MRGHEAVAGAQPREETGTEQPAGEAAAEAPIPAAVYFDDASPPGERPGGLDADAMAATVREVVAAHRGRLVPILGDRPVPPGAANLRIRVAAGTVDRAGAHHVHVASLVTLERYLPDGTRSVVQVEAAAERSRHDAAATREAVREAVREGLERVETVLGLEAAPPARVAQTVLADDEWLRERAIAVAAQRHLEEAVRPIESIVVSEAVEDAERRSAITALGQIGSDKALEFLGRIALHGNGEDALAAVQAIASIGSERARAYLETLARAHPDELVRRAAATAGGIRAPGATSGVGADEQRRMAP